MSLFGRKPGTVRPAPTRGSLAPHKPAPVARSLRSPTAGGGVLRSRSSAANGPATSLLPGAARPAQLLGRLRPVATRDRVLFLKQLAMTLRAGLCLTEALQVCQEQAPNYYLGRAIGRMVAAIQHGASLSQAMMPERRHFSEFIIRMVETAEASGEMAAALDQVAAYLDQRAQLRGKLITSLMYPAFVVVTAVGVATFLVVKVLPKFVSFLARRDTQLPWTTQLLLDIASFTGTFGVWILGGCIAAAALLIAAYLTRRGRFVVDRVLLAIPVVGKLIMTAHLALLSRTLAMLLRSGVTLLESLPIAAGVMMNRAVAGRIHRAAGQLLHGTPLSHGLRDGMLPGLFVHVVAVGERTGNLGDVLDELADHYASQLQVALQRLVAMIEPALLILIGVMVGFVYQAFFHALVRISTGGR